MKKISKKDLQGLSRLFPVLGQEEMRRYVGGFSSDYSGGDWFYHGFGGYDPDGNFQWHSGYTLDEFENWDDTWYGGWVYGIGYVAPDFIYGYQSGDEYWGSGFDDFGYGESGYGGPGDNNYRGKIIRSDWACLFNCMNYLDASKRAKDYYKLFSEQYEDVNVRKEGGVPANYRSKALEACGFSCQETGSNVVIQGSGGYKQIVIFDADDEQGRTHAGIATGGEGDLVTIYDPTLKRAYEVNKSRIAVVYKVENKKTTVQGGSSGYSDYHY